jgi:hypothetical protein
MTWCETLDLMTHSFSTVSLNTSEGSEDKSDSYLDSGHGGQTKDLDGDEIDGFDEGP